MTPDESTKERHARELLDILRDLERHPRWGSMMRHHPQNERHDHADQDQSDAEPMTDVT